jgi:hypothetical protein
MTIAKSGKIASMLNILTLMALPRAEAKDGEVNYRDGFLIEDRGGRYTMRINAQLQSRLTHSTLLGYDDPATATTLTLPRVRLRLSGSAHEESLRYALVFSWDDGAPGLQNAWMEQRLEFGVRLRAGQFKIPSTREWGQSGMSLVFAERSLADDALDPDRDIGVMAHTGLGNDGLRWAAGVFAGAGRAGSEKPPEPLLAGRVAWSSEDLNPDEGLDLRGEGVRGGIGAFCSWSTQDQSQTTAGIDGQLKAYGGSLLLGAGLAGIQSARRDAVLSGELSYVIASRLAPAVRSAWVFEQDGDRDIDREYSGGLTVLIDKTDVEWQSEVSWITGGEIQGHPVGEVRARSQLQFAF